MTRSISQWASAPMILSLTVTVPPLRSLRDAFRWHSGAFGRHTGNMPASLRQTKTGSLRRSPDMRYPPDDLTTRQSNTTRMETQYGNGEEPMKIHLHGR